MNHEIGSSYGYTTWTCSVHPASKTVFLYNEDFDDLLHHKAACKYTTRSYEETPNLENTAIIEEKAGQVVVQL